MEQKIIRIKEVLKLVPICRSTIYKQIDEGKFPRPIKLGTRARAWRIKDIEEWIETRESA